MPTVRKSALVHRSAADMFRLVDEVEHYPDFLPWCSEAKLYERTREITRACIGIDYHGLSSHITTLNRKSEPERMDLEFVEGPFDHFKGHWRFVPLGEGGCRIEFELEYAFSNAAMDAVVGPVFGHIAETLVDRFVAQAETA